ncbi:MAG: hypothetical protein LBU73_07895 [Helicobacteraceae bacterium]|nr:hypothetical protein [Helicobacteraceae bacterium]
MKKEIKRQYEVRLIISIGKCARNLITTVDGDKGFCHVQLDPKNIHLPRENTAVLLNPSSLANYVADWLVLLDKFDVNRANLVAEFHLNNKSNKKIFRGDEISDYIDSGNIHDFSA